MGHSTKEGSLAFPCFVGKGHSFSLHTKHCPWWYCGPLDQRSALHCSQGGKFVSTPRSATAGTDGPPDGYTQRDVGKLAGMFPL